MERKSFGQIGYEAYGETANWRTYDGRPMPSWDELGTTAGGRETQRRWEVAVSKVIEWHRPDRRAKRNRRREHGAS